MRACWKQLSGRQHGPAHHGTAFWERQYLSLFNWSWPQRVARTAALPPGPSSVPWEQCSLGVLGTSAGHMAGQCSAPSCVFFEDVTQSPSGLLVSTSPQDPQKPLCYPQEGSQAPVIWPLASQGLSPTDWRQFRDAIKASGQSAGFSPMLAAPLGGVSDLMPIRPYPQPGRPSLISWLQVSEVKPGLRATKPLGRLRR